MNHKNAPTVLITDYAWPDNELEKNILDAVVCHVIADWTVLEARHFPFGEMVGPPGREPFIL